MKNYLKLQAKKSMSLFLAVLMVLSCWVWFVAPADVLDAKAGTHDLHPDFTPVENYKIKLGFTLSNDSEQSDSYVEYKVWCVDQAGNKIDGYTTIKDTTIKNGSNEDGKTMHYKEETIPGFPYYIECASYRSDTGTSGQHTFCWNYVEIIGGNNSSGDIFTDQFTISQRSAQKWSVDKAWLLGGFTAPESADATHTQALDKMPETFKGIPAFKGYDKCVTSVDSLETTLPELGVNAAAKELTATFKFTDPYDNYGVKWKQAVTGEKTTVVAMNADISEAIEVVTSEADGVTTATVKIKPELQSDVIASDGKREYRLVHSFSCDGVSESCSIPLTINYPEYTLAFNGGLEGAAITTESGAQKGASFSYSVYNGAELDLPKTASKLGYTFCGFWSEPQPTSGLANYAASKKEFAQPCSTEDFNNIPGVANADGIKTDEDGNNWYNAGRQLDLTADKQFDAGAENVVKKWYGWWISDDITIRFYDVDGQFLAKREIKSGTKYKDFNWPTSRWSTYTNGAVTFTIDHNNWVTADGTTLSKTSSTGVFTEDLILTPALSTKGYTSEYSVNFIMPDGASVALKEADGTDPDYRANIATDANNILATVPKTLDLKVDSNLTNEELLEFNYKLVGWTTAEPYIEVINSRGENEIRNYHVLLEDADFDSEGTSIALNKDWVVRGEATYYPVYRRYTKTYVVDFTFKDATGADVTEQVKVKYRSNLVAPIDSVPYSYVTGGFGYTFTKWSYNNTKSFGYDEAVPFTLANVNFGDDALDDGVDVIPVKVRAVYGSPVATQYTVTFNYIFEGKETTLTEKVSHDDVILGETVEKLKPAKEWENEDQLYTYADKWEITSGVATVGVGSEIKKEVGAIIDTADLEKLAPISNITFKAVYADPIPYYTVTYIDGTRTWSDRVLRGSDMPAWILEGETEVYVPADYEGEGGTYEFQGWFDAATGGNEIDVLTAKVTDNITLYSQFKFEPFTYTITFMNHDGSVQLGIGKYEKGQNIEVLTVEATKAANGRLADDVYTYVFLGWDKAVPTFCEGYDVTYTALYKAVYKYYDAKWYNSSLDADGNWVANKDYTIDDEGKKTETNLLATTHHTYNSKLYTPSINDLTCLETAEDGQTYVFAGWYYNDADGNAVKYERGMKITAEMEFYATYTLTAKTHTVTTVVKGVETKYTVADGAAANIPDPKDGYVAPVYEEAENGAYYKNEAGEFVAVIEGLDDSVIRYNKTKESCHNAFAGWYTDAEYKNAYVVTSDDEGNITSGAITADTELYAKFVESSHDFTNEDLKEAPTYYAVGKKDVWCDCDKAKTKKSESIPMLTDTVNPTGTIYLGNLSWSSTDEIGGAALDEYDDYGNRLPATIVANAKTNVIVTANDTGIGVKFIRAFAYPAQFKLTATSYLAARDVAYEVYTDTTENLTNNANFSIRLGDIDVADLDANGNAQYNEDGSIKHKPLESGEEYILYYYVIDKAGNQLNSNVRTAAFIYDDTAPEFTVVNRDGNEASKYCGIATVTGIEKGATLTVNGTPVNVNYAEGAETGTYEIEYAEGMQNVTITATDSVGNEYTKKIKIADHVYIEDVQHSTCTQDGYKKEECLVCGYVKSYTEYKSEGHDMTGMPGVVPATCAENGYEVIKCQNCDYQVENVYGYTEDAENAELVYVVDGEGNKVTENDLYKYYLYPALGHKYAMDNNGEIIYTTVTASTCCTKGEAEAYCAICGEERIFIKLDLDTENHEFLEINTVAPDCENNGYYTVTCRCSTEPVIHKDHITDPDEYAAKGHGTLEAGTAEWVVRTEPTCYQDGEEVLKCLNCPGNVKVDGKEVTRVIAATGEHVKVLNKDNGYDYTVTGIVKYKCATEGCTHVYNDKILENATPEKYTVTFFAEDGKTELGTATVTEGNLLETEQAPVVTKDATIEYEYTFAGWLNGDKVIKLPYEVTEDITLKATFKATKIKYTHVFSVPTSYTATLAAEASTVTYATLVGTYGDVRVPSGTPVLNLTGDEAKLFRVEFKGWKHEGAKDEEIVTDFTVVGNAEFVAVFEPVAIEYKVTFYNGTGNLVWNTTVDAGEAVVFGGEEPTKAFDGDYHYAFSGWYTDEAATNAYNGEAITADTRLYAGFTAIAHDNFYVVNTEVGTNGVTQAQTCVLPELTEYICSECGHTKSVETKEALGHKMGEYIYDEATGKMVSECENCDVTHSYKASVTINFVNESGISLYIATVQMSATGTVEYAGKLPEKAADNEYTYVFAGWKDEEGNVVSNVLNAVVPADKDATYTAYYTAVVRTFTVRYVDNNNGYEVVHYFKDAKGNEITFKYGDPVPAAPEGLEALLVVPAYEQHGHKVFDGWNISADAIVTGNMNITPKFKLVPHDCEKVGETGATCEEKGGAQYMCACGYGYIDTDANLPALGHVWDKGTVTTEPNYDTQTDGVRTYKCTREGCDGTKTEAISGKARSIKVTVYDDNGKPIEHATVRLYKDGVDEAVKVQTTNANGVTIFTGLDDGKYSVYVVNTNTSYKDIEVNEDGSVKNGDLIASPEKEEIGTSCQCTCHKNTFWGMIFRFFQKIIKLFTGKASCCACPSEDI